MAETPLSKKLRIKSGHSLAIIHAPEGYRQTLGDLPDSVMISDTINGIFDIVQSFYTQLSALEADVAALKGAMADSSILWLCYPKGSAKWDTDLNRDIIWKFLQPQGLKPVAQVSIDTVWSAMRFKLVTSENDETDGQQ